MRAAQPPVDLAAEPLDLHAQLADPPLALFPLPPFAEIATQPLDLDQHIIAGGVVGGGIAAIARG
jgi:hypothetical protein